MISQENYRLNEMLRLRAIEIEKLKNIEKTTDHNVEISLHLVQENSDLKLKNENRTKLISEL